jgi:2-iminobutanoate/2-iminopropanoate deaminase
MSRRSVSIESFVHHTPIPVATRIGPLLVSSVIPSFDPFTRNLPDGIDAQVANVFDRAEAILAAEGAGWGDVARMTFFVADLAFRDAINEPWAQRFPDPASRPARHTQVVNMGGPMLVNCDLMAYIEPKADIEENEGHQ